MAPAEIPLLTFVAVSGAASALFLAGGHYIGRKLYESANSPSDYYSQRRLETTRNGALQGLAALY